VRVVVTKEPLVETERSHRLKRQTRKTYGTKSKMITQRAQRTTTKRVPEGVNKRRERRQKAIQAARGQEETGEKEKKNTKRWRAKGASTRRTKTAKDRKIRGGTRGKGSKSGGNAWTTTPAKAHWRKGGKNA